MPKDVVDWTTAVGLPWQAHGGKVTVGGGAESFVTTAVELETQTLGIGIASGAASISGVKVVGNQSGVTYLAGQGTQSQAGWFTCPVNGVADSTYTISWLTSSGVGTGVSAFTSALTMGFPTLGQSEMDLSVPVTMASDQTAFPVTIAPWTIGGTNLPWQAPRFAPKLIQAAYVGGVSQTILPAPGVGNNTWLFWLTIQSTATGLLTVDDGVVGIVVSTLTANASSISIPFGGAILAGPNRIVELTFSVNATLQGVLIYSTF